mmetsp:Transcript_41966/g.66509  ORF Transcript_41966/g.66509 Transcript_41966/m.66509 type:complete len:208 (-) Transcript_41966:1141-1764(-)
MLFQSLFIATDLLLHLGLFVSPLFLHRCQGQLELVHLRSIPQGRRSAADGDLMHCVLGGLSGLLRIFDLLGAPVAILLKDSRQLFLSCFHVSALTLLFIELGLQGTLLLQDFVQRQLFPLQPLAVRGRGHLSPTLLLIKLQGSQCITGLGEVDAHTEVKDICLAELMVQYLRRIVHLSDQAADFLGTGLLLHAQLPHFLVRSFTLGL